MDTPRFLAIQEEVRARLRAICAHMPDSDFSEMVIRIALVQLTFESDPIGTFNTAEARVPLTKPH